MTRMSGICRTTVLCVGLLAGVALPAACRKSDRDAATSGGVAPDARPAPGVPQQLSRRPPSPTPPAARRTAPRAMDPTSGAPSPRPSASASPLLGLWGVNQILIDGRRVPLPKVYRIRLVFKPGGVLVVHGVHRTKPTTKEGTWEVHGAKLHTSVGGVQETRTFRIDGTHLTLVKQGQHTQEWRLERMASPGK